MTEVAFTPKIKSELKDYLEGHRNPDLVATYLLYIQRKDDIRPVVVPREKTVYRSYDDAVKILGDQGKLWRETEIVLGYGPPTVNELTAKIYICPFTGKVFGDNTHPNPQDAIYDWVSKCPENKETSDGIRVKRFFVSEDPKVIANYIEKRKEPTRRTVYSSSFTGKLFHDKDSVIRDFRDHHSKGMTLVEVQNQNRFEIEESFLEYIQSELVEDKITSFVEALAEHEEFLPYVQKWVG